MGWFPSLQILRLDQNNITTSLDLANINITGPIAFYDHTIKIIVLVTIVIFLVTMISLFLYWSARKDKYTLLLQIQQEFAKQDVQPTIYAYNDIKIATRDFHPDMKIGQGSFGVVYKGVLQDQSEIAVKQLLTNLQQGIEDFLNEVVLITNVKHKNLVKFKGCCVTGGGAYKRLLVYEFVDNNNLAETNFENKGRHDVDWPMRKNICLGVARGLNYLHEDVQPHIIHREIKASNILLDRNFNAKIANFGLARFFPNTSTHISTLHIAGTRGYLAPEYATRGQLSEKVDVFSFGVLVLEIVTGRKNIEPTLNEDQTYLLEWVWKLHEDNKLLELVDQKTQLKSSKYKSYLELVNASFNNK
ncbi:unnamed protein product [Sphagnum troendelagicum]|uniref:Protein kinase domain-containing protein n=1 Tax=Sphagnum troendelagicum TaxID=128251 RepID=A0ABP0V4V9_9BRYO